MIFGVLTTVAAFTPMLMVPGPMGQVFSILAKVVVICLIFSLIESQLVLPAHLARGHETPESEGRSAFTRRWKRLQRFFGGSLERFAAAIYRPALERALEWRYTTIAAGDPAALPDGGASGQRADALLLLPAHRGRLPRRLADHASGHARSR